LFYLARRACSRLFAWVGVKLVSTGVGIPFSVYILELGVFSGFTLTNCLFVAIASWLSSMFFASFLANRMNTSSSSVISSERSFVRGPPALGTHEEAKHRVQRLPVYRQVDDDDNGGCHAEPEMYVTPLPLGQDQ
jgi:hypothetical protein